MPSFIIILWTHGHTCQWFPVNIMIALTDIRPILYLSSIAESCCFLSIASYSTRIFLNTSRPDSNSNFSKKEHIMGVGGVTGIRGWQCLWFNPVPLKLYCAYHPQKIFIKTQTSVQVCTCTGEAPPGDGPLTVGTLQDSRLSWRIWDLTWQVLRAKPGLMDENC